MTHPVNRLAVQSRRQAQVLYRQAQNELALAPLQPRPEDVLTRIGARQKIVKAQRLRCLADQLERTAQKENGPRLAPGPFENFRFNEAKQS